MKTMKETTAKKTNDRMVIRINPWEVSIGHQEDFCGCGVHRDKRERRNSRGVAKRKALEEYGH